jgi:hypothetical protein
MAPWNGGFVPRDEFYCVTDCDVVPDGDCPDDVMDHLKNLLDTHEYFPKAGLALRIDDIPDFYPHKQEVITWEKRFWNDDIGGGAYYAPTDTTFAVYPPYKGEWDLRAMRSQPPYQARHLGWYLDSNNLAPDIQWYYDHMDKGISSWSKKIK